jgi:erythronate-4-phosphate dehydrogenase
MTIVCDRHIPFLAEAVHSHWPDVQIYPMESEQITNDAIREADVLVVRTRTHIDKTLLQGSRVKMVCTATIGYDHIDTAYCEAQGIRWMSCPGCNAQAVCDYVEEALREIESASVFPHQPASIGIVGVGHVGSLVADMARRKGYEILLNDPPKGLGVSLDSIAQNCDIITFHTPLDPSTRHLCDQAFLQRCRPHAWIINAARGGIVDERALLRSGHPYIIDTWESEPLLNADVLAHAFRASMHIAGYSIAGKRNATQMCLDAIADTLGLSPIPPISTPVSKGDNTPGWLERITAQLKKQPESFELLRQNYPLR